jgi:hypothetical protein
VRKMKGGQLGGYSWRKMKGGLICGMFSWRKMKIGGISLGSLIVGMSLGSLIVGLSSWGKMKGGLMVECLVGGR